MGFLYMTKEPPAASEHRFELVADSGVEPGTRIFYFVPGDGLASIWDAVDGVRVGGAVGSVYVERAFSVDPVLSAAEVRAALPKANLIPASFRDGQNHTLKAADEKALIKACKGRLTAAPVVAGLLSLTQNGSPVEPLAIGTIKRALHGAQEITLLSAYVDPELLKALLIGIEGAKKATLRLVFDAREVTRHRGESRGPAEHCSLDRALSALEAHFKRVEKRVMSPKGGGIFHSKLILAKTDARVTAFIGSANATMRGMECGNEEILARLDGAALPALESYVDRILAAAQGMDAPVGPTMSLTEFLLRGTLFFKPTNPLKLTYNPFSEFLGDLEPEERGKVSANETLPDAEPGTGLSAFDLERALIALGRLAPASKDRIQSVRIKSFAIETCYGYWVPEALIPEFKNQLVAPETARRERLEAILSALTATGEVPAQDLLERYRSYLSTAATWVDARELDVGAVLKRTAQSEDPFGSTTGFERFVATLVRQLDNDRIMARRSTAYLAGPMPDLRIDRWAEQEFIESFFEYVAFANQRDRVSRVATAVLRRAHSQTKLGSDPTPESIRKAFEKAISREPWADEEWLS